MGYISGMAMGNIIQKFLEERNIYTPGNYKSAYNACKLNCHKISSGTGKSTRYKYYDSEILPILTDWSKSLNA